jgi:DNA-binding NarL/FixJ family response regulator
VTSADPPISILIADDHPVVRSGLRGMLSGEPDLTVAGEAASGAEAVAAVRALRPSLVLMDLRMPGGDGVTATQRIGELGLGTSVIILTTHETDADILRAVAAGATGYLLKDASRAELLQAIRAAARGETVLAPSVAGKLWHHRHHRPAALSPRETEILALVAQGLSNSDIAAQLHVSEATIKTHLQRAFTKLGVSDRTAAVTTAIAQGILECP